MIILVTGGAGYIGSICAETLLEQGHTVIVVDNLDAGHYQAVPQGATFYHGDFGDRALLEEVFRLHSVDAVFHFAAKALVPQSMIDPGLYFEHNLAKGIVLLETMRAFDCERMIFSSTAATFGEPQQVPIDEDHPQVPINPYGESKLMFERMLGWYHRIYGLKFNAFRYFNAAGASRKLGEDHHPETHLIPVILQVVLGLRDRLQVFGSDYPTEDGTCVRDYIHVQDLAEAHIRGLDNLDRHPSGKYNLGNGQGFTILEVIRVVEEVTGKPVPFELAPRRPGDPAVLVASSALAQAELGWEPRHSHLEVIVESAWKWFQAHPRGYAAS